MSGLISIAKFAATTAASLSVGKVLNDIIKNNVTITTRVDKYAVNVGGFILGSMIVDKAREHLNKQWEEAVEDWKKSKSEAEAEEEK